VNDITLLDSWVISAQGYFTKNSDLFPEKISSSLNGCPIKAIVRNGNWSFTTQYMYYKDSNGSNRRFLVGAEMVLLKAVYEQMNMTFIHVNSAEGFDYEVRENTTRNVICALIKKKLILI
jgi:hypothetical protein